jgi:hypothetical protein
MQKSFSFDKETVIKIFKGASIAASGAVLTYLAQYVSSADFGVYTPVVVAVSSIIINAGKEFIKGK